VADTDKQANTCGIRVVSKDVTDCKRVEDALSKSEARLQLQVDRMPIGCIVWDREFRVVQWNPAAEDIFGFSAAEAMGRHSYDLIVPREAQPQVDRVWQSLLQADLTANSLNENVTKDGRVILCDWSNTPLTDDGTVAAVLSMIQDVTKQAQADDALRESQARFRLVLQDSSIVVFDQDRDLRYTKIYNPNPAFSEQEVLGKRDEQLLPAEDAAALTRIKEQVLRTGLPVREEVRTTVGGEAFFQELKAEPIYDDGEVIGLACASMDISKRKRAEMRIQNQLERLAALRAIDLSIAGSTDVRLVLNVIVAEVVKQLRVDATSILLLSQDNQTLRYAAGYGFRGKSIEMGSPRVGEGVAGRVALKQRAIYISSLEEDVKEFSRAALMQAEAFVTYYGIPLVAGGRVQGVLEMYQRTGFQPDQEWFDFAQSLAGQAAIAIENARLFDGLHRSNCELILAYDATIEGWSRALDLRDKETEGHTHRVSEVTQRVAIVAGIGEAEIADIRRGALLHDIGKMGVPDSILLKPDKLTDEEWDIMRQHPQFAFEMLSPIAFLRPALDIPYCHHEKWDGSGYPQGLKGEHVPFAARLFAVVDVWDALSSARPYREAWSEERVYEHIRAQAGTHFDPKAVELFFQAMTAENEDQRAVD